MEPPAYMPSAYVIMTNEWLRVGFEPHELSLAPEDETILKGILDDDHRYIEAHDILSEYYEKTQQYKKAQDAIQTATQLSPKSIRRHRRLASAGRWRPSRRDRL